MRSLFARSGLRLQLLLGYLVPLAALVGLGALVVYPALHRSIDQAALHELDTIQRTVLDLVRQVSDASIKNYLRGVGEKNRDIVAELQRLSQDGSLGEEEAKRRAASILTSQRIGSTGYIYCLNSAGLVQVHPVAAYIGDDYSRTATVKTMRASTERAGYVEYEWKPPLEQERRKKALYFVYFEPWDWYICISSYREEFGQLLNLNELRASLGGIRLGKSGYVYVLDRQGNLLVHPHLAGRNILETAPAAERPALEQMLAEKTGRTTYAWQNPGDPAPRRKLVLFDHLEGMDWIIATSSYSDEYSRPLVFLGNVAGACAAAVLLLVAVLTAAFASGIVARVRSLTEACRQGALGNAPTWPAMRGGGEIAALAGAVRGCVDDINASRQTLQREVETCRHGAAALGEERDRAEQSVAALTLELQRVREQAEAASQARSRFLANLGHDIRTPLNAILGLIHLAVETRDEAQRQGFLHTLKQSAQGLLCTFNEVLDVSAIEAGQIQFDHHPFRLGRLLQSLAAALHPAAAEKGLTLKVIEEPGLPTMVLGDDHRLHQILANLMSAAIAGTSRGAVTLKAGPAREQRVDGMASVHFRVMDTGSGITPEQFEAICASFERADGSCALRYGRGGLALGIGRRLTTLMDGVMWVECQAGQGGTVHCVLDFEPGVKAPEEPQAEAPVAGQVSAERLRILLADDNEVDRGVTAQLLDGQHEVTTAANGLEVLAALRRQRFDLILMDVQMPVLDGLAAAAIIRAFEQRLALKDLQLKDTLDSDLARDLGSRLRGGHIPIMAMTANTMGGDRERCLAAGMDGYLGKPYEPARLSVLLQTLVAKTLSSRPAQASGGPETAEGAFAPPVRREAIAAHFAQTTGLTNEQVDRILTATCLGVGSHLAALRQALSADDRPAMARAALGLKDILLRCGQAQWAGQVERLLTAALTDSDEPCGDWLGSLEAGMADLLGRGACTAAACPPAGA